MDLFSITQVCRVWRDAALSCQMLWTHVDPSTSRYPLVLQRSGNAPLRLECWTGGIRNDEIAGLDSYTDRFVSVDLLADRSSMMGFLRLFKTRTWNTLQILSLETDGWGSSSERVLDLSFSQPPPNLRRLHLTGVVPESWNHSSMYRNLTKLHLEPMENRQNSLCRPTMSQILVILEDCTSLEKLSLVGCLQAGSPPTAHKTISLDRLQVLKLGREEDYAVRYFLLHCAIPETTHFFLECTVRPSAHAGLLSCLPQDVTHLPFLRAICAAELANDPANHKGLFSLCAYYGSHDHPNGRCCFQASAMYEILYGDHGILEAHRVSLLQLGQALRGSHIKTLKMRIFNNDLRNVTVADWRVVLPCFPSLTSLRLHRIDAKPPDEPDNFLPILHALIPTQSSPDILLPALQSLHLENWTEERLRPIHGSIRQLRELRASISGPSFQVFIDTMKVCAQINRTRSLPLTSILQVIF